MALKKKKSYRVVNTERDKDYYCPLDSQHEKDDIADEEPQECIEKDVVERYSGNIDIRPD